MPIVLAFAGDSTITSDVEPAGAGGPSSSTTALGATFPLRDLVAALFFFVFGLSIDVGKLGSVAWLLALAVVASVVGKIGGGYAAGIAGGFAERQSLNVGVALVAHGEFTIILAQIAEQNPRISEATHVKLAAFAGLYVLVTAVIGVVLMKESKAIGRWLFVDWRRDGPRPA